MLGPLDQRRRITRCEACARRRIKCQGGIPCEYCTRMHKACVPPVQKEKRTIFINKSHAPTSLDVSFATAGTKLSRSPPSSPLDHHLGYFFSTFLTSHDFTGRGQLELGKLVSSCQVSPSLHSAIIAVSALNSGKRVLSETRSKVLAIKAYQDSLVSLQLDLDKGLVLQSEACLWSTFFLGIFELMYDASGEGWVKHILYGTSKMLQARGADQHISGYGRSFYLTVRVFEICRALIYVEDTILSEESWKDMTRKLWQASNDDWHPKEALFDILIDCASLRCRTHEAIDCCNEWPLEDHVLLLKDILTEGLRIKESLTIWHSLAFQWQSAFPPLSTVSSRDLQMVLAIIYYHATRIFLSGIFDYFRQFDHILEPKLTMAEVQADLSAILTLTEIALKKTNLAGVLFFYPLRVAGARARTSDERTRILEMLADITRRSFVVADTFSEDLSTLWHS